MAPALPQTRHLGVGRGRAVDSETRNPPPPVGSIAPRSVLRPEDRGTLKPRAAPGHASRLHQTFPGILSWTWTLDVSSLCSTLATA
ncbi:hypothetical protein X797_002105 [Metarhizium robertsii]|uniref:Uncharacterized protein n=1 Tax=Metarhizium robertsii TaxID=568076 RepID=A0A0A1V2E4_9HYPO|nr:hypothetical protein X797_002105 [Metarhizium robertsii]